MNAKAKKARAGVRTVNTVKEFIDWTEKLEKQSLLYRGLANAEWDVESAASRRINASGGKSDMSAVREYMLQLLTAARMYDHGKHEGRELRDLELTAKLQHSGAATCLIDFTHDPLVALWFACQPPKKDGKVVGKNMDATALNLAIDDPEKSKDDITNLLDGKTLRPWSPTPRGERIIAQRSIFVFGKEKIEESDYEEVRISYSAKEAILDALRKKFGITEESLFADFTGFALANAHDKPYKEPSADDYYKRAKHAAFFSQAREYKKAIQLCDLAIAKDHKHIEAYYLRGNCKCVLKKWQEGVDDFSQAIKIDEAHVPSLMLRGLMREYNLGEIEKAKGDYTKVIELASDSGGKVSQRQLASAYRRRSRLQAKLGNEDAAENDADKADKLEALIADA